MITITVNRRKEFSFEDTDQDICHLWSKQDFEGLFNVSIPEYRKLNYEPDRGLYIICKKNLDDIHILSDPSEDPFMEWIHNNVLILSDKAYDAYVTSQAPDPDDILISEEVRRIAIKSLKDRGVLSADFPEPEEGR